MTTYITLEEAQILFPNATEYSTEVQQFALETSYSMVNSYLNSTMSIPAIASDGTIPGVIKIAQAKFFQYILESSNHGYSDELQSLLEKTSAMLAKLTKNELIVSEIKDTAHDIGWKLQDFKSDEGWVFVSGEPPDYQTHLMFKVKEAGYCNDVVFEIYRTDSEELFAELQGNYEWRYVNGLNLLMRFDGRFSEDDTFIVIGKPDTRQIVSNKPQFQQVKVLY